ncbi:MAG: sensor histidine kinase [Bryobacteraceae bacterium]
MNEDMQPGDELILAIVHDLRAGLRRSLTSAQMLDRSAGAKLDAEPRQLLAAVIEANKDSDRFLGRLSDFANASHISDGRPIPLQAALQIAAQQFPSFPVQLPDSLATANAAVPREFVRLFAELFDNGLKFSGGSPLAVGVTPETVEIADSGIGVHAGEEERIFEPLVRLHSRDLYPGFGLGLAICRRIAGAAGASVRIVANSPAGARAIVTLPSA